MWLLRWPHLNLLFMGVLDWIPVVGDVVKGIGNVASTAMTNSANKDIAKKQNEWNVQQWNREADFTREMWNATNEYNDPSNQMKRLTDAGLSPWAAASVMGAGDASGVTTPTTAPAAGATMQAANFDFLGEAAQKALDNYLSTEIKQNEARKSGAEADSAETEADMKNAFFQKYWKDMQDAQLQDLLLGIQGKSKDVALKIQDLEQKSGAFMLEQVKRRLDNRFAENQISLAEIQVKAGQIENKMRELRLQNLPAELKAQLAVLASQEYANIQSGNASKAAASESFYRQCKTILEAAGVKRANEVADALADVTIQKAKADYAWNERFYSPGAGNAAWRIVNNMTRGAGQLFNNLTTGIGLFK